MSTGERRWTSARRGGMTVLGKVAVPKPINLPSQKLENHGLDPRVEIVPKGTLSWGNKSSSSASNPWGSSTSSPNVDGGNSPNHLSNRPSSAGSGTRPSTAGSDKALEANAWGPSSRPSSASGSFTSNQTSVASLRPLSADKRPGSSQLSRFADPSSEHSVAWAGAATAEKLGMKSSKNNEFSPTSGDFPSLGSEKDSNHCSYGHPSSSGGAANEKGGGTTDVGDVARNENVMSGTMNSWNKDNFRHSEEVIRPNMENYLGHPQHYEPWRGPPLNPPGAVWYRGPPGGPPYGAPPPGAYPMEPFPYYRPHIPSAAFNNPQSVASPGGGPRGRPSNHPKNGDMYRPHMPEAYIRPGMPTRPGFYPGPVAYDGYYATPMGYCNLNERDIPFMERPVGPSTYNRYPSQNVLDPRNSSASYDKLPSEQGESVHDHQGPCRMLLTQHIRSDGKIEEKWGDTLTTDKKHLEKDDQLRTSWDDKCETDQKQGTETDPSKVVVGEEASHQTYVSGRRHFPGPIKARGTVGNNIEFGSEKNLEHAPSSCSEVSQSLKEKAQASDGQDGVRMQQNQLHLNLKDNHSAKETGSKMHVSAGDKSLLNSTTTTGASITRRPPGMQVRTDHQDKGRLDTQEFDGWRKRFPVADPYSKEQAVQFEASSSIHVKGLHASAETTKKSRSYSEWKDESAATVCDPSDFQTQREKMRELAHQRVKQLQKEEEERINKQKAGALAKLEDLDRRTRAAESAIQKSESVSPVCMQAKQQESTGVPITVSGRSGSPDSSMVSNPDVSLVIESKTVKMERSLIPSCETPILQIPKSANNEHTAVSNHSMILQPAAAHNLSVSSQQDANNVETSQQNNDGHLHDGASKQNASYKQRSSIPSQKNYSEKKFASNSSSVIPTHADAPVNATKHPKVVGNEFTSCHESSLPVMVEPLVHQRRKNNKNVKNKHKVEPSATDDLASLAAKELTVTKSFVESTKQNISESKPDPNSVQSPIDKDMSNSSDHCSSLSNDEARGRINGVSKSQYSRRMPRNQEKNRFTERLPGSDAVWAPVGSHNKNEATDKSTHIPVVEAINSTLKSHPVQNNAKNKRTEIERYIPKPVAQEMAQHGSPQQPVKHSLVDGTIDFQDTKSVQPVDSAGSKVELPVESRNRDSRSTQGKTLGSRHQHRPADSVISHLQDGPSYSSSSSRNVQTSTRYQGTWNPDLNLVKEQQKLSDQSVFLDGWNMPDSIEPAPPITVPIVKDQGVTGRAKRHPFKGRRGTSHDDLGQKSNSGDADRTYGQSSVPPLAQADKLDTSKNNRGVRERSTSHWQPKSQTFSASNQQGSRHYSDQNIVAEVGKANLKESSPQAGMLHPQEKKETGEDTTQHQHDQFIVAKSNVEKSPNVGHQVVKMERKTNTFRGHQSSPNQDHASTVGQSVASTNIQHEHHSLSGFHKNGNHNNRFGRGHESRDDWSSMQQDTNQHNPAANQERHRQNVHSEHRPAGPYNNNRSKNIEGPKDGYYNKGPKFKERGQDHSRRGRGNFNPRQSGSVQEDSSYDW